MKNNVLIWVVAIIIILAGVFLLTGNGLIKSSSGSSGQENGVSVPSTGIVREFNMTAKDFEFDPETIEVNAGDKVVLNIVSTDVKHGIALPAFGVSQDLNPGEKVRVEFVADKKGTYTFFCNVYCGEGHRGMKGSLIVN